jgi:hypothetical protein
LRDGLIGQIRHQPKKERLLMSPVTLPLAVAVFGYGLIGILVIIVLVIVIMRLL